METYALKEEHTIVAKYSEKKSAKDRPNVFTPEEYLNYRPVLKQIFDRARTQKDFDELWVWRMDRFSRSDIPLTRYLETHCKIKLFALHGLKGEFGRDLELTMAREENRVKVDRVVVQQLHIVQNEKKFMCKAPVGYIHKVIIDGKNKRQEIEIDPVKSKIVKEVFQRRADGETFGSISKAMNLQKSFIFNILRNRAYLGEVQYKNQWYKGSHTPLVPVELFNKANSVSYSKNIFT